MPKRAASPLPRTERNEPRRGRSLPGLAWRQFRRVPATTCFLAAVWAAGLVTGNIAHGPPRWLSGHAGAGPPSLGHGYWWIPLRAALLPSGLDSYLAVTVLGLVILVPAEHRMGATRTFTTLLASQAAGLLLAAGLVKLAQPARGPWLYVFTRETAVDVLPGVLGVGFALSYTLAPRWRRRLRLLLTVAIATGVMYIGHLEQVAQACGAASGLVITALTYDRGPAGGGNARVPARDTGAGRRTGCGTGARGHAGRAGRQRARPDAAVFPPVRQPGTGSARPRGQPVAGRAGVLRPGAAPAGERLRAAPRAPPGVVARGCHQPDGARRSASGLPTRSSPVLARTSTGSPPEPGRPRRPGRRCSWRL